MYLAFEGLRQMQGGPMPSKAKTPLHDRSSSHVRLHAHPQNHVRDHVRDHVLDRSKNCEEAQVRERFCEFAPKRAQASLH